MFNVFYFNGIVNNSHMEYMPLKYLVHFAEWFPSRVKGYKGGGTRAAVSGRCCGRLHVCGNIFLVLKSV